MQKIIYRKNDYESPSKKHNMGENRYLKGSIPQFPGVIQPNTKKAPSSFISLSPSILMH